MSTKIHRLNTSVQIGLPGLGAQIVKALCELVNEILEAAFWLGSHSIYLNIVVGVGITEPHRNFHCFAWISAVEPLSLVRLWKRTLHEHIPCYVLKKGN